MTRNLIEFLALKNTVVIRHKKDFDEFLELLQKYGLEWILGKNPEAKKYDYWRNLVEINFARKHRESIERPLLIFEYDVTRGITFYTRIQDSVDWYGEEPFEVKELV